jgi:hypothetical protein
MLMECTTDVPSGTWERIVNLDPNSYYFHTPAWAKIIEQTYGYRIATRLYTIDGVEFLIPMMAREKYGFNALYSMPMGYGNIFTTNSRDPEIGPHLSRILDDLVKGQRAYLNLSVPPFFKLEIPENIQKRNIAIDGHFIHIISLHGGLDDIWKNKVKNKKAIRKAEKNLTVREGSSIEDYEQYYRIYAESSKRWGYKTPPQPFELYKNMLKYGSHDIKLHLAYKNDVPVAGLVSLNYGNKIFAFTSCYLKEYATLRAQNLLTYHSIKQGVENGYLYFDFGSSMDNSGIIRFKESFSPDVLEVKRYIIMPKPFNSLISTAYKISRKIKKSINR